MPFNRTLPVASLLAAAAATAALMFVLPLDVEVQRSTVFIQETRMPFAHGCSGLTSVIGISNQRPQKRRCVESYHGDFGQARDAFLHLL